MIKLRLPIPENQYILKIGENHGKGVRAAAIIAVYLYSPQ